MTGSKKVKKTVKKPNKILKEKYIGRLAKLQKVNPEAYNDFVQMLVEDCEYEFSIENGIIKSYHYEMFPFVWDGKNWTR